jgi:hypothetical protein
MGEGDSSVLDGGGDQDAVAEELNPRQGYHTEVYNSRIGPTRQVWFSFEVNGELKKNWCVWNEPYDKSTAAKTYACQQALGMVMRYVAHAMNTGLSIQAIYAAVDALMDHSHAMPDIAFPDPWFYWGSAFDYNSMDESAPDCTHYFVQRESKQCLVWKEDTFVAVDDAHEHGINWVDVTAVLEVGLEEESEDAEEENSSSQ